MAKYIDKSAVVAEIEGKSSIAAGWYISPNDAEFELCNGPLSFLDTLEVKEVDLEKEFYDFLDTLIGKYNGHLS